MGIHRYCKKKFKYFSHALTKVASKENDSGVFVGFPNPMGGPANVNIMFVSKFIVLTGLLLSGFVFLIKHCIIRKTNGLVNT